MDFSKLGSAAAASEDMTQNKTFEREIPVEGVALLRLLSYIELGRHESNNPAHKPALKAMLTFELNHPKHMIEIDGKKVPQQITVRLNKGMTAKSGFRKLFNVMNKAHGNKYNHFVQMIGLPFLGEVFHNTVGEGDKKQVYANLQDDAGWSLKAPLQIDALSGTETPIPVAELDGTPKAFLWENDNISDEDVKAMWDSLFIEGEREVEDSKTKEKKTISKNWIQETIKKNIEWEGSVTQALVEEHVSLDEIENQTGGAEPTQEPTKSANENTDLSGLAKAADKPAEEEPDF
ncbi:hypothetical protein vBAspPH44_23 [Alteromonas phage vB_AspP-H4/4]|uniref:Uncharacterized protein n=1 Tax=Alteromonas phage vB_AspP-H4/4 TaxID=2928692 RepID=A0A220YL61_9CAUD|nr:hypothetical protein HOR85_gp23 [Alteromonas phage vB_AspP-H4/4]ASL24406.1 hypothetical protein vBAspPH44_23 [Alteromonas phage vB_AspP-H4/4]